MVKFGAEGFFQLSLNDGAGGFDGTVFFARAVNDFSVGTDFVVVVKAVAV